MVKGGVFWCSCCWSFSVAAVSADRKTADRYTYSVSTDLGGGYCPAFSGGIRGDGGI